MASRDTYPMPSGLDAIRSELPQFIAIIAQTARWVHPSTFDALPVWYPEHFRGQLRYKRDWRTRQMNRRRGAQVREANVVAGRALRRALGAGKPPHWTVCHIWGNDDPKFQKTNDVVKDPKYYSCVANMVWLPTPLKGFTDSVPEIKFMMRICAFLTYGWVCEHPSARNEATRVRKAALGHHLPLGYPKGWPRHRGGRPTMTAPYSAKVMNSVAHRKRKLASLLRRTDLPQFPRRKVREALRFWKISLGD